MKKDKTRWAQSVGPGWQKELVDPFLEVWVLAPEECQIAQIKEKFAQLRIYVNGPEWWQKLAETVMSASHGMCEKCGRRHGWRYAKDDQATMVKVHTDGWWKSRCQFCGPTNKEVVCIK